MWDSNGDINGGTVQFFDDGPGDMKVSGKIDGNSLVVLVSKNGSITVSGKIDGNSNVTLHAPNGSVAIGSDTTLSDDDRKIDGNSNVEAQAGSDVTLGSYIHNAVAEFRAHGKIIMGEIDYGATVRQIADGDILLTGQINGNEVGHGPSRVELVSNSGSITINGRIDSKSNVYLTAGQNIAIGANPAFSDDERKVDGDSFVTAIAGGNITLGSWIRSSHTVVDLAAGGSIAIAKDISGDATVRLLSAATTPQITVTGPISGGSTHVTSWPPKVLVANLQGGATLNEPTDPWVPDPMATLPLTAARAGYWWENWGQTLGYVAPFRVVPQSVDDISQAVIGSGNVDRPDLTPVKAIGGGWSFSDAVLPFTTQAEVDQASTLQRGRWQQQDLRNLLEGRTTLQSETDVLPMDLLPQAVTRNTAFSTMFDPTNLRQVTSSGAQLPASGAVRLIDTRSLASSLQCEFQQIQAASEPPAGGPPPEILFQVEAGITMADLQQLLDHQSPRLALQASGGSPGATLAGALSTATHGAEFKWPLLVDCVRAVHLVGPGGLQWWIEGDVPVADPVKLMAVPRYHQIVPGRFIDASWNAIPGLTGQDVLKAVAVSMGTMGVIYSVVLAVQPQFGLHQVVHPTTWSDVLAAASVTEQDLRSASAAAANQAVLDVITGVNANGTEITVGNNVFANLAINPFPNGDPNHSGNHDCWIVNREVTAVPDDPNTSSPGIGDYLTALTRSLSFRATGTSVGGNLGSRILDFLCYGTGPTDIPNDLAQVGRLASFITGSGDTMGSALAAVNMQDILNVQNAVSQHPDRGQEFLADMLTGFVHALEGTGQGRNPNGTPAPGTNSDITGVSYKVGAIGWPPGGLPGRGLEIALDSSNAFSFLQTVLFDDILINHMSALNEPLVGYISIRVCPQTQTLMGMQQMSRLTITIEVVSYRSPQSDALMDIIQSRALAWSAGGTQPLLHWGLENDQLTGAYLAGTPLGQPYKTGFTRLDAFKQIRTYLTHGNAPVFDNNFTTRLGL